GSRRWAGGGAGRSRWGPGRSRATRRCDDWGGRARAGAGAASPDRPSAPASRRPNRVHDEMIAGTAAEIAGNCLADLGVARRLLLVEQGLGRQQEPGRTEPALQPVVLAERLLDGVESLAVGQAFHRHQRAAIELEREEQAASDRLTVEQHRAGAAHAVLAADVGAGEVEVVAEKIGQRRPGLDGPGIRAAVDGEADGA